MDYDDNDFHCQHFQLVGEDNVNFSSGLCSFSLPKVDLDDQVHLRFDNLVEPDSLLGIQAHEQNSWYDDFSAGNSVIEFTSSAVESCSVSRHNNVWSEATSNESVGVLLKAVEEDDIINKINTDSDTATVLDSTGNQMDTWPGKSDSNVEEMVGAGLSNVQMECHNIVPESNESTVSIEGHGSIPVSDESTVKVLSDEATEQAQAVDLSGDEVLGNCESFEGAGVTTAGHHIHDRSSTQKYDGNLPLSPVKYYDEDEEELSKDENYGQIVVDEKPGEHSHKLESAASDRSVSLARKDFNLSSSNTLPEISLPTFFEDPVSGNPNNKKSDKQVVCPREPIQMDRCIHLSDDEKLAHESCLIGSETSSVPAYEMNSSVFLMEDRREEAVAKLGDHAHMPGSAASDCSDSSARKVFNLSSSNTSPEPSLPVSFEDAASGDPNGKISDNQVVSPREPIKIDRYVHLSDDGKLAYESCLIGSESSNVPAYEINSSVFLLEDHKEEVVAKKSDGLLDVVVSQMKVLENATPQDNTFGELKDVCRLEVYSQEKKEENAGELVSPADTNGPSVSGHYHQESTELISFKDDEHEKSVTMMKQKQGKEEIAGDFIYPEDTTAATVAVHSIQNTTELISVQEEGEDEKSISMMEQKEKAGNAGDLVYRTDATAPLVYGHSLQESTELMSIQDDEPEKSVSVMDEKLESESCQDQSNCKEELPVSAVESCYQDADSNGRQPSDAEEQRLCEPCNHASNVSFKVIFDRNDNASQSAEANLGSSVQSESTGMRQSSIESLSDAKHLCHISASATAESNPVHVGNLDKDESGKSNCDNTSVLPIGTGETVQTVGVTNVQVHDASPASVHEDISNEAYNEGKNVLTSQCTNVLAPQLPEGRHLSPTNTANVVVEATEKSTLPVADKTVSSYTPMEESSQNSCFLRSSVQESCNNIQTAFLHQPLLNSRITQCSLDEQSILLHDSAKDASCSELDMPTMHVVPKTNDSSISMEKDHPSESFPTSASSLIELENLSGREVHPYKYSQSLDLSSEPFVKPPSLQIMVDTHCSVEPSCSSPTVISCSKQPCTAVQDEPINQKSNISDEPQPSLTTSVDMNSDKDKFVDVNHQKLNTSEDDRGFSFKVGRQLAEFSEKDSSCKWKSFSSSKTSELDAGTPSPAIFQRDSNVSKGEFQGNQHLSNENLTSSAKKSSRKEKTKLGSAVKSGSTGPSVSSRRKSAKESPVSRKKSEKSGKHPGTEASCSIVTVNKMQTEEMRQSFVQGSNLKTSTEPTFETPKLPDLNTASATALFNQPFTDAQQVQLRAQIFVYGSLIQGMPPDESIMVSAFGDPDGGRVLWEGAWHAVAEKYYKQKSPLCETPARPVIKSVDFASRCSPFQGKTTSTPQSYRAGAKSSSPALVSSPVSLPSPVWSIPSHDALSANVSRVSQIDASQTTPPMQAYLSPQVRQQTASLAPWFSQCSSAPWTPNVNSSSHDVSSQLSTLPVASSIKLPTIGESAVPRGSNIQLTTPSTYPASAGHPNSLAVQTVQIDANKNLSSPNTHSEQKSRKRKKDADSDAVKQLFSVPQSQSELKSLTTSSKPSAVNVPVTPSARASSSSLISTVSPVILPTHFQIIDSEHSEHKVIFSEETCSKVEQAKLQAEDAAAFASAAVRHSESIWSQLALQRNAGLLSEVEQKLASSAAAAAAAVAVAKAAAAAAKVAADSALQAKLMADEAAIASKAGTLPQGLESGQQNVGNSLATFMPASVSIGTDKANSSVISAALEGVRRRVEAASAAAKRAELLDAIVKAAELAAGAVSHAGALVALPDPLPFSLVDILDAGPQNYWKTQTQPVNADPLVKTDSNLEHAQSTKENAESTDQNANQIDQLQSRAIELPQNVEEDTTRSSDKFDGQPTENYTEVPLENEKGEAEIDHNENGIQEGSVVEVASVENGLGVVWYSARVLNIKDGQAYVCYNTLHTNGGSDKIKEWIPLESGKESAPRIRTAHPSTTMKNEGTRKRGRAAVTTYVWSVGDRVDAWLRDGWCEGVVIEKSHLDDTKLTVCFSAGGESSIVRSWDLRPSLVWVNGQWAEWIRADETLAQPNEGDTPREKRQKRRKADEKLDSSADAMEVAKTDVPMPGKLRANEESAPLALSATEKIFSAGQVEESNTSRVKRTGLQKEGSKVIFGVPKPGRRRKFMDVSKHCVVDKMEKVSVANEPFKSSKHLVPQSGHEKNGSKVGTRDKYAATHHKVKLLKSAKSQLTHTRTATVKESPSTSLLGPSISSRGRSAAGNPADKPVFVADAKLMEDEKQNHALETSSYEQDKTSSIDDNLDKNVPGSGEPRRSNRRIQPTSRLLEGLQSSMIISKIPSFSHDKGGRVIRRTTSSTRGRPHG